MATLFPHSFRLNETDASTPDRNAAMPRSLTFSTATFLHFYMAANNAAESNGKTPMSCNNSPANVL